MNKMKKNALHKAYIRTLLATSISAVVTGTTLSGIAQASDIDIYQTAKSGDITLMFMLDISGSMRSTDVGATGSRFQRVEQAMGDLLSGNAAKGIAALDDDKIYRPIISKYKTTQ